MAPKPNTLEESLARLTLAHEAQSAARAQRAPGREPVHVVYGGGHLFRANTAHKLGSLALAALAEYAPDPKAFTRMVGVPVEGAVYARLQDKLRHEPVEDFRLDFEDGYGQRPAAEEDGHALQAADEV